MRTIRRIFRSFWSRPREGFHDDESFECCTRMHPDLHAAPEQAALLAAYDFWDAYWAHPDTAAIRRARGLETPPEIPPIDFTVKRGNG